MSIPIASKALRGKKFHNGIKMGEIYVHLNSAPGTNTYEIVDWSYYEGTPNYKMINEGVCVNNINARYYYGWEMVSVLNNPKIYKRIR